jgi:hypothetical protein
LADEWIVNDEKLYAKFLSSNVFWGMFFLSSFELQLLICFHVFLRSDSSSFLVFVPICIAVFNFFMTHVQAAWRVVSWVI